MNNNDWRRQGQEHYLIGATLVRIKYADRVIRTDHDHCEFCFAKFSDTIPDSLTEGYTTTDDYRWICDNCYADIKEQFKWLLIENT